MSKKGKLFGTIVEAGIIDKALYFRLGDVDMWLECRPSLCLRFELDLIDKVFIVCLVGLEFRLMGDVWERRKVAEGAIREEVEGLEQLKEKFK